MKIFSLIIFFGVFLAGLFFAFKKDIWKAEKKEIILNYAEEKKISESVLKKQTKEEANPENLDEINKKEEKTKEEIEINQKESKNSIDDSSQRKEETPDSSQDFEIKNRLVSWGYSISQNRSIDTIILHSSYNAVGDDPHNLDDIIEREYKPAGVSPHYIISREGKVYRLVEDKNIAYHAGVSQVPDGRKNVNDFSLGIEIVNTGKESPNSVQYKSIQNLLDYLKNKYKIKYILGHSDIASGRKTDPWNFDWGKINKK